METIICDEVNVKKVEFVQNSDGLIDKNIKPNFKVLGPKAGKMMGKLAAILQSLTREQIDRFEQNGIERVVVDGQEIKVDITDVDVISSPKEGFLTYEDDELLVALDLSLSQELIEEGIARELINRIQNMRKENDFEVTDRIEIYFDNLSDQVKEAVQNKTEYIKHETLALEILNSKPNNLNLKEITIGEESLTIGIRKKQ